MNKIYFILTILIITNWGYGQEVNNPTSNNNIEYSIAYNGNLFINPGLKLGMEYEIGKKTKTKLVLRDGAEVAKTKVKQLLLNGNIGFYWDPKSHVGTFATAGLTYRKTYNNKRQFLFSINPLGYFRSILPETYEVKDDAVSKVTFPGRNYYAPSISFGLGKDRSGKRLNGSFINLTFMVLTPYNNSILPQLSIEYGYRFGGEAKN